MKTNANDLISGPMFLNFGNTTKDNVLSTVSRGLREHPGLTKREYFSALIMAGIYSNGDACGIILNPKDEKRDNDKIAKIAVKSADALIEALNKNV